MNYRDPQLRDQLAGEYVLGTLAGRARRRFERLLRDDMELREAVAAWERRLGPLIDAVPAVAPPKRVWRAIKSRVAPAPTRGVWQRVGFWRSLAAVASVLLLVAAAQLYFASAPRAPGGYVAVLNDRESQPAWVVSAADFDRITIKALESAPSDAGKAYELWLLPGADRPPRSLGLLPTAGTKTVTVPGELRRAMAAGKALAVSLEPPGGSPTGLPTGPVLYQGVLLPTV